MAAYDRLRHGDGLFQFGLLYPAIKLGLPAGLASLVMQSQAFFTLALAVVFLGERPLPSQIAGAIVAFGGLAVIGMERMTAAALIPLLMGVGSAIAWPAATSSIAASAK